MTHSLSSAALDQIGPITLPLRTNGSVNQFTLRLFPFGDDRYLVAELGQCHARGDVLVRVSSMCNFGHIWGSEYCDCAWQLNEAKRLIALEGCGVIVFAFDQHGKGVGLENHYRVYTEGQRAGLELVVDAYKHCGFPEDLRQYDRIVDILKGYYELTRIRLLTNSPRRIDAFQNSLAHVTRVPLEMPLTEHNCAELTSKKNKLGHLLSFTSPDAQTLEHEPKSDLQVTMQSR